MNATPVRFQQGRARLLTFDKARLDWDDRAERFTNNDQANELLDYEYRQPWSHA